MKKLLVVLGVALLVTACLPKLPEIFTLQGAQLPVAAQEDVLWQSDDYNGKPMLVVFMGSWCPWCKKTMPALVALQEKYGDKVEIVGAFMDEVPGPVRDAAEQNAFTVKALYNAGEVAESIGVNGLPHTVLFNKKHQAIKVWEGYRPDMEEVVSVEIDKLVK